MIITNRRKKKHILQLADIFFYSEEDKPLLPRADILNFYQSAIAEPGAKLFHTLHINLTKTPDELRNDINRRTRADLNKSERMGFQISHNFQPNTEDICDFLVFSERFSSKKNIIKADKNLIECLAADGGLHMSKVCSENGDLICRHVYLTDKTRVRALYSVSIRLDLEDRQRHIIGIANRALHWADILRYRESGYRIYDFGGISPESEDSELKGITEFKTGFGGIQVLEYHYIKPITLLGKASMRFSTRTNADL